MKNYIPANLEQISRTLRSVSRIGTVLCAALIGQMLVLGTISDKQIAALAGVELIQRHENRNFHFKITSISNYFRRTAAQKRYLE